MNWEIEEELENTIPLHTQINLAKKIKSDGNEVALISDMYLPEKIIKEMLKKAGSVPAADH